MLNNPLHYNNNLLLNGLEHTQTAAPHPDRLAPHAHQKALDLQIKHRPLQRPPDPPNNSHRHSPIVQRSIIE